MSSAAHVRAAAGLLLFGLLACEGRGAPEDTRTGQLPSSTTSEGHSASLDSLMAAGAGAYSAGDFEMARKLLHEALGVAGRGADSTQVARILTSLGLASYRLGDYEEARRLGEGALELKLRLHHHETLFRSYNALGLLAWNEGRLFDASDHYEKAFEVAEARRDTASLAKVSNNLGLLLTELGDFPEARRRFLDGLNASRAAGDAVVEGRVLNNLGMLDYEVGNPLSAIAFVQQARPVLRAAGDVTGEQNALGQLGVAYAAIGEPGRSIAYLDSALQQSRVQGLRQEEAGNLELLGERYHGAGDFGRALELYAEAQAINRELGLALEMGTDLRAEAEIHAALGNLGTARELADRALEIHRRAGARFEELRDLLMLAELAHEDGRSEETSLHLAAARQLAERLEAPRAWAGVALSRARLAEREEDALQVLRVLDAATRELSVGGYGTAWELHALKARAHARLGALDSAAAAGRRAMAAVERVRGQFGSGALRTSYTSERATAYWDLVDVLLLLGLTEEAFEVADAARGRALLEQLAASPSAGPGSGATVRMLAEGERHLLRQIDSLLVWIDELSDTAGPDARADLEADLERLNAQLQRARADYEAALVRAEELDPVGLTLAGGRRQSAARVKSALRPGEVLLQYLVMPEKTVTFVVTRDAVRVFETRITRANLASRVRVARDLLARRSPHTQRGYAALEALYETLIAPAARAGSLDSAVRLIIVPQGELNYLPFAALRDVREGIYLAERYVVTNLPSAAALPVLREREKAGTNVATAGAAAFAPYPEELPATSQEVSVFRQQLSGASVYLSGRATESNFRRSLAEGAIVHAATHGILNARSPMFSRIELARGSGDRSSDDGRFEVHELMRVSVTSPLVFLSGCETGVGAAWSTAFERGEDYATLAQAFLYAGASNVIATLWRVEDEGAAAFAESFYRHLRSRSAAESLAAAQREMIAHPRYGEPYYWAPYRLSGTGELVVSSAQESGPMSVRH